LNTLRGIFQKNLCDYIFEYSCSSEASAEDKGAFGEGIVGIMAQLRRIYISNEASFNTQDPLSYETLDNYFNSDEY
jgi:hypothetical protein